MGTRQLGACPSTGPEGEESDGDAGSASAEWRWDGGGGGRQDSRARTLGDCGGVAERKRAEGREARLATQASWGEQGPWRCSSWVVGG